MSCSDYKNCATQGLITHDMPNLDSIEILAVGCWGVYCNGGDYVITKFKNGKYKKETVNRGQKSVAEALIKYTKEHRITDMYLAGDNIYDMSLPENEIKSSKDTYNIDLQISEGFENCFKKANIDRFYLAVGNHDIEYCDVLDKQKNYDGWIFPSMYYNVFYNMKNFTINVILIDTNMLEDDPVYCDNQNYRQDDIDNQFAWAKNISKGDWKVVIGHIPYIANGHKEKRPFVYNSKVEKILDIIKPQLYICADEHNQQVIYDDEKRMLCLVAGSGGTALDILLSQNLKGTLYKSSSFGFVSLDIKIDTITAKFINTDSLETFSTTIDRDGNLLK